MLDSWKEKLASGTHIYRPLNAAKLAPLYIDTLNPATTFFGLQRVPTHLHAFHLCPVKDCSASLQIDDFAAHYQARHFFMTCRKSDCRSWFDPHNPDGKHDPSCVKQIICSEHSKLRMNLKFEDVKKHVLDLHLKLGYIECPHCPKVLKQMSTLMEHMKTCSGLRIWSREEVAEDSTMKGKEGGRRGGA
ncbi:hypothetical protein DFS33DRAFT_1359040 [Desarmillaria ectypa]|nr:hypothetical protein DFS33DRAFT_1359040 [Desarmillaria ectypa]